MKQLKEDYKKEKGFECWTEGSNYGSYTDDYVSWLEQKLDINYTRCCTELPTKEAVILEGEKQIVDWLEENAESDKQAYRIGFRRSFEYVLRVIEKQAITYD